MAGTRQHYLPQLLLKGFAGRITRKEYYTWVFSKKRDPFEANITKVGVEKYFYGKSEQTIVDDQITERETEFGQLLDEIRAISRIPQKHELLLAEFVVHLLVRTKHARESLGDAVQSLLDILSRNMREPQ